MAKISQAVKARGLVEHRALDLISISSTLWTDFPDDEGNTGDVKPNEYSDDLTAIPRMRIPSILKTENEANDSGHGKNDAN